VILLVTSSCKRYPERNKWWDDQESVTKDYPSGFHLNSKSSQRRVVYFSIDDRKMVLEDEIELSKNVQQVDILIQMFNNA
jgi:hypothetical protein